MIQIKSTHITTIGADAMVEAIAGADSSEQADFLMRFARRVHSTMPGYKWLMQCRYITDSAVWDETDRAMLINQLEDLVGHLKEPTIKPATVAEPLEF